MTIKVYKSDFSIFSGLYNAVVYLRHSITIYRNFVEVDFGPEHMNPYIIRENKHITGNVEYNDLMSLCFNHQFEPELIFEVYDLLNMFNLTTDQIMRRIDAALAYPPSHRYRRIIS
jgi:hypothetical protein